MFFTRLAIAVLGFGALLSAQSLPPGTALPLELNSNLSLKNARAGQHFGGKLKQEIRLGQGVQIKAGSRVTGHVIEAGASGTGFHITLQFDQLQDEHKIFPLNVSLRALADSENVFNAGLPSGNSSTYESSTQWVTRQVGGQFVFRDRGTIESDHGMVGTWSGAGTWGKLTPAGDCAGDSNNDPQSLWIFSTTACGIYGYEGMQLSHAGRTPPMGQITLVSAKPILLRGGSGLLLVINPGSPASAPAN